MSRFFGSAIVAVALSLSGCATQAPAVRADSNAVESVQADESNADPDESVVQEALRMIEAG